MISMALMPKTVALAVTTLITLSNAALATDHISMGYYVKGYKGSEEIKYFPRGLEITGGRTNILNTHGDLSTRYRYLTSGFRTDKIRNSTIHQIAVSGKYQIFQDEINLVFALVDIEGEWESIDTDQTTQNHELTTKIGVKFQSNLTTKNYTEAEVSFRKSTIPTYDSDIVLSAMWNIGIINTFALQPKLQASFDFEDTAASVSIVYGF